MPNKKQKQMQNHTVDKPIETERLPIMVKSANKNDVFSQFNKAIQESENLNNQITSTLKKIEETEVILQKELSPFKNEVIKEHYIIFDKIDPILTTKLTKGQQEFLYNLLESNIVILRDQYEEDVFHIYEKYFPKDAAEVKEKME